MDLTEVITKARIVLVQKLDFFDDEEKCALIAEPNPNNWDQALEAVALAKQQAKR